MQTDTPTAPNRKILFWAGWILSALLVLFMGGGAIFTLIKPAAMEEGLSHLGYPPTVGRSLLLIEIVCAVLYVIPQTSILGAILLTGYLGGATASHVRVGEPWFLPVVFGVIVWLGLYLRDTRLHSLIPLRR